MNPLAIVIISAAILIGVVAGLIIANNNKKIFASGAARQNRNYDFYMQEHIFKTNVTDIKALLNALDKDTLTRNGVSISIDQPGTKLIFSGSGFAASLKTAGASDISGIYMYRFRVGKWKEYRGTMDNSTRMGLNVLLTSIEKAFLTLDYNAVVERTYVTDISTKSSFF